MDHGRIAPMGALLLLVLPLMVSMEMDKIGIPGIPGIPGFPGKDGRNGLKGDIGEPAYTNMKNDYQGNVGVQGPAGKRGAGGEPGGKGEAGIPGPPGQDELITSTAAEVYSAFSVSRAVPGPPQRNHPIIFSNVITNYNNDFNTDTGRFRCSVPGTYYFVYHASSTEKMCILLMMNGTRLGSWCDIKTSRNIRQVSSGGLAVYLQMEQEVWLETSDHRAMTSIPAGVSLFSGFLMHPHE